MFGLGVELWILRKGNSALIIAVNNSSTYTRVSGVNLLKEALKPDSLLGRISLPDILGLI